MLINDSSFYQQIKNSKKILVLDLGFLGDTVHLIPTLWCVKQALPNAVVHVMVAEHIMSLMDLFPWIDEIIGYPRFPKGPKWYQDINRIKTLRQENYDCIINVNGSQRSLMLTWAIHAPFRLGRIQPRPFWLRRFCLTHAADVPFDTLPMYEQRWQCLKVAGFPGDKLDFPITIPPTVKAKIKDIIGSVSQFIHISPFTTEDNREIQTLQLAQLLNKINQESPKTRIALSCAPNEREQQKLLDLLIQLDFRPWKTFPGTLNLIELTAFIQKAKVHLGGDSGALHLALMTGTPTLSWFQNHPSKINDWMPRGPNHRAVIGETSRNGLLGIMDQDLLQYCLELLSLNSLSS